MVFQPWSNPAAFSQSLPPPFSWSDWNRIKLATGRGLWLGTDRILGRMVTQTLHKQAQEWACLIQVLQPQGISSAHGPKRNKWQSFWVAQSGNLTQAGGETSPSPNPLCQSKTQGLLRQTDKGGSWAQRGLCSASHFQTATPSPESAGQYSMGWRERN